MFKYESKSHGVQSSKSQVLYGFAEEFNSARSLVIDVRFPRTISDVWACTQRPCASECTAKRMCALNSKTLKN